MWSRRPALAAALAVILVTASAVTCAVWLGLLPPVGEWARAINFGRVREGMTRREVLGLVGHPDSIDPNELYKRWYYPLAGRSEICVSFYPSGRVASVWHFGTAGATNPHALPAQGMTERQVLALMGHPSRTRQSKVVVRWRYWHSWNNSSHGFGFDRAGRVVTRYRGYVVAH